MTTSTLSFPYPARPLAFQPDTAPLPPGDWPMVLARAAVTLALAAWLLARPPAVPGTLALLVAALMLLHGALAVAGGLRELLGERHAGTIVFEGVMGLGGALVVLVALAWPGAALAEEVAAWAAAAWALLSGAAMVATAMLHGPRPGRAWLFAAGVLSAGWAVFLMAAPTAAPPVFATWVGVYALLVGAALLGAAVRLVRRTSGPAVA